METTGNEPNQTVPVTMTSPPEYSPSGQVDSSYSQKDGAHYPPPQPMQPMIIYQQPPTEVYSATTAMIPESQNLIFRDTPLATHCHVCQTNVITKIKHDEGLLTWLIAGTLCLFGCWCGCCLIPFCIDECKNVVHSCPNCNHVVGIYKRL
ncbi:lipopolysaccharide-induced tumor necrosis factor-alpha factor homolog [Saccoglossus kowalevskii]|uniref:Lipopolysaccharide-induced tumor necrosis factor-alpha factor homolog n=1 Tax=Saccoglossus kowalevskii TaxID=10224 RepID=A0ABM0GXN8_SACKO|nr:PREDICTED: lipopolysaccharide-induced tumor necrosis factor-alpha factor homolog [Saccoglossus kowalevskii]